MFTNDIYFLFVPNYIGNDKQEATIYTFSTKNGITKQILWIDTVNSSSSLPYFDESEDTGFQLVHVDEENKNKIATYIENGNWTSRNIDLDNIFYYLGFEHSIRPFYLPLKTEPYKKPILDESFFSLVSFSVITNAYEDKKQYSEILTKEKAKQNKWVKEHNYRIFYDEVAHKKFLIPFMPETKSQESLPACESYAFAALYKQNINKDFRLQFLRNYNPDALIKETDISYFGMQQYIRGNNKGINAHNIWMYDSWRRKELEDRITQNPEFHFDFEKKNTTGFYMPLEVVLQNEQQYDKIPSNIDKYYFSKDNSIQSPYDVFIKYLEKIFKDKSILSSLPKQQQTTQEISVITGIPLKKIKIDKALRKQNFNQFLYALFFEDVTDFVQISGESLQFKEFSSADETKQAIADLVQKGYPVKIGINVFPNSKTEKGPHAVVVDGYKKAIDSNTGKYVDLFKIHNSWGKEWEFETNNGWFLADNIIYSLRTFEIQFISYGNILKPELIETSETYKSIFKNNLYFTKRPLIKSTGTNQTDASLLYNLLESENNLSKIDRMNAIKKFIINLGYELNHEDKSKFELYFKPKHPLNSSSKFNLIEIWTSYFTINFGNYDEFELFKSQLDFSNAKFCEGAYSKNEGFYIGLCN